MAQKELVKKPTMAEQLRERFYSSDYYKEFKKVYVPFEKEVMDNLLQVVKKETDDSCAAFEFFVSISKDNEPLFFFPYQHYLFLASRHLKKRLEKEGFEVKVEFPFSHTIVYMTIFW